MPEEVICGPCSSVPPPPRVHVAVPLIFGNLQIFRFAKMLRPASIDMAKKELESCW